MLLLFQIACVALIIITVLAERVDVSVIKKADTVINVDFTIIGLRLTKIKEKNNKRKSKRKLITRIPAIVKCVNYLLKKSHIHVRRLVLTDAPDAPLGFFRLFPVLSSFSALLAYVKLNAAGIEYDENALVPISFEGDKDALYADIKCSFSLFHLIISLFIFLYCICKARIKRGIKKWQRAG